MKYLLTADRLGRNFCEKGRDLCSAGRFLWKKDGAKHVPLPQSRISTSNTDKEKSMEKKNIATELSTNAYPGRGIIIGRSKD